MSAGCVGNLRLRLVITCLVLVVEQILLYRYHSPMCFSSFSTAIAKVFPDWVFCSRCNWRDGHGRRRLQQ